MSRAVRHHGWAVEQFQRFPSFITCEAVVAEAAYLTGSRLKRPTLVIEMLAVGVLEIAYSLHGDEENVATVGVSGNPGVVQASGRRTSTWPRQIWRRATSTKEPSSRSGPPGYTFTTRSRPA